MDQESILTELTHIKMDLHDLIGLLRPPSLRNMRFPIDQEEIPHLSEIRTTTSALLIATLNSIKNINYQLRRNKTGIMLARDKIKIKKVGLELVNNK